MKTQNKYIYLLIKLNKPFNFFGNEVLDNRGYYYTVNVTVRMKTLMTHFDLFLKQVLIIVFIIIIIIALSCTFTV